MSIVMNMKWDNITLDDYDRVRDLVNWEGDVPKGKHFSVVFHDGTALHVTDVYESAEDFQNFVDNRLMPAIGQLGIQGQPKVEIYPVHDIWPPAFKPQEDDASLATGRS